MKDAYKLDHKIWIEQNTTAGQTDGDGNPINTWVLVTANPIWAQKKGLTGRMFYQADATQAQSGITFTVRFRPGISSDMRVVEGRAVAEDEAVTYERIYEMSAPPVDVDGQRRWLDLHCKEVGLSVS